MSLYLIEIDIYEIKLERKKETLSMIQKKDL
jgi:hypothetical protein